MLCRATNPNLPGCVDRPGDDDALRVEERAEVLGVDGEGQRCTSTRATSTSASTAIGPPSTTISGLRSAETIDRVGLRRRATDRRARRSTRSRSTARLAPERPEQALRREVVDQLLGVDTLDRHQAERDVGDRLGEHAADAEHHGHAELRVEGESGDELAVAAHHRRDEHRPSPSSGRAAASSSDAATCDVRSARRCRGVRARARSCARWRRRTASRRPGSRARRRPRRVVGQSTRGARRGTGTP